VTILMSRPTPFLMRDRRRATMREVNHDDLEAILAMGARCSDESIQNRFFGPRREPNPAEREMITDVDGRDRHAILVDYEGDVIAVGRWIRNEAETAPELAFLVEDSFHSNGIGSALLEALILSAERAGHERLTASVLGGNKPMLSLFDHSSRESRRALSRGIWDVELELTPQ
jgi:GNAT superfamily N-acetyltransferase